MKGCDFAHCPTVRPADQPEFSIYRNARMVWWQAACGSAAPPFCTYFLNKLPCSLSVTLAVLCPRSVSSSQTESQGVSVCHSVAEQWLRLSVTQSLLGGFLSFYPSPPLPLPLPTSSSLLPSHPPSLAVTTVLGEDGARGDGRRRKTIVFNHFKRQETTIPSFQGPFLIFFAIPSGPCHTIKAHMKGHTGVCVVCVQ